MPQYSDYPDFLDRNNAEYNIIPNESTQFPDPLESGNLYSHVVPDYNKDSMDDPLYYTEDEDIPLYTQQIEKSVVDNTLEYDPLSQRESSTSNQRTSLLSEEANVTLSKHKDSLTFKQVTTILSESFLGILNDFLINERPDDVSLFSYIIDVFTKENRPLFLGVILVVISTFFIFFSKLKNLGSAIQN